jgi:DNA-binding MarR family transcriptional regulator
MTLPSQFTQENTENIFIYHYVEEMIANYGRYLKEELEETDIKRSEIPFLIRIRFKGKTTQKELVELFKVSEGYTAKLLRKFEDNGYITRCEDPSNRRKKIVELTDKGMEKNR